MNDTPRDVEFRFREMVLTRSPSERLAMACRMFTTARALVLAGIPGAWEDSTSGELRRLLFLRTYGQDFGPEQQAKILSFLG
jgi:hypothetical protein